VETIGRCPWGWRWEGGWEEVTMTGGGREGRGREGRGSESSRRENRMRGDKKCRNSNVFFSTTRFYIKPGGGIYLPGKGLLVCSHMQRPLHSSSRLTLNLMVGKRERERGERESRKGRVWRGRGEAEDSSRYDVQFNIHPRDGTHTLMNHPACESPE